MITGEVLDREEGETEAEAEAEGERKDYDVEERNVVEEA